MYNNPYMYNTQLEKERLDSQIAKLQEMRNQLGQQQTPSINQTFQLAPQGGMRYVNSIEDVKKEIVYTDTPFFSSDLGVLWLKNAKGDIKSYELKEIVRKDEKDLIIDNLQMQINEMKEMIKNAKPISTDVNEPSQSEQPEAIPASRTSKKK